MTKAPKVLLLIESSRGFGRSLLTGIAEYARFHGPWSIYTFAPFFREPMNMKRLLQRMVRSGLDGIVAREMDEIPDIQAMKIPAVFASTVEPKRGLPQHQFPVITTHNADIAVMAAHHLLERGFVHFAYCGYDDISWSRLRQHYFADTLSQAGYSLHVYQQPRSRKQRLWENEMPVLCEWLESLPKPIGLMTCCDDRSQNIAEAAKVVGIHIPEEIAVIGVDNDELVCHLASPPFSSIALATEKAGFQTAQLLDRLMQGQETMAGQQIVIPPTCVVSRGSTDTVPLEDTDVVEALQFIRNHIREPIQVSDVASAGTVSRRTLERRFLKSLGRSVQEEINRMRVEQLTMMLTQTRMTQVQIAHAMGYHVVDNMRRFFHRHMNMTPLHYRKKFAQQA